MNQGADEKNEREWIK